MVFVIPPVLASWAAGMIFLIFGAVLVAVSAAVFVYAWRKKDDV